MTERGNDMSKTESSATPNKYPPVTYLTMAYEPINTMHAVISAIEQDYPGEKTIVLIHQDPARRVESALIEIKNAYAVGKWPGLWLDKLEAFTVIADPHTVAVWWDEDDRFDGYYTSEAVYPIMQRGAIGTWTDKTYYVKRGEIVEGTYPRSNGTLAIRTDILKKVVPEVRRLHPQGHRVKNGMALTVDPTLIKVIGKRYSNKMRDHAGMRYYFMRNGGNGGPRRRGKGVNIDE